MKNRAWTAAIVLAVAVGIGACTQYPTRSTFHRPTIESAVVFPEVVGRGDSVMVTVIATDADGDSLRYNWYAFGPLFIKGSLGGNAVFDTRSNSQVFYRSTDSSSIDTTLVRFDVEDGRGGVISGSAMVLVTN